MSTNVSSPVWRSEKQPSRSWTKPSTSGGGLGADARQRPQWRRIFSVHQMCALGRNVLCELGQEVHLNVAEKQSKMASQGRLFPCEIPIWALSLDFTSREISPQDSRRRFIPQSTALEGHRTRKNAMLGLTIRRECPWSILRQWTPIGIGPLGPTLRGIPSRSVDIVRTSPSF